MKKKEFGDFQTPVELAKNICLHLKTQGISPTHLLEPTCGIGNFVVSALEVFPDLKYIYCIEINPEYKKEFYTQIQSITTAKPQLVIEYHQESIYSHEFSTKFLNSVNKKESRLLIIGNPPWVTNSTLSTLNSRNVPKKTNKRQQKGLDALTGKSNFDIAEFIITDLVEKTQITLNDAKFNETNNQIHIAMLCKQIVVRNITKLQNNPNSRMPLREISSHLIDAKKWFKAATEAALFIAKINKNPENFCKIFKNLTNHENPRIMGWIEGKFVSNSEIYNQNRELDRKLEHPFFIWRQGIKHDLSKVMEVTADSKLIEDNMIITNKNGFTAPIELNYVYPLCKGSNLGDPLVTDSTIQRFVIIPQKKLGQSTDHIQIDAPRLWNYLQKYKPEFQNRKSSIYKNKPSFSIFGVGEYSFLPYKIGLGGMYKKLNFAFITPINNKPVMLDDTCYFIAFKQFHEAFIAWSLLKINEIQVTSFLHSLVFINNKRPWTKEVLSRINWQKLVEITNFKDIKKLYSTHFSQKNSPPLLKSHWDQFTRMFLENR